METVLRAILFLLFMLVVGAVMLDLDVPQDNTVPVIVGDDNG